ncbi:hypothetical protein VNO78_13499 [Psophocarpus tetragonolobus]|uniref:Uncharacterized protein n=1 Tax=Psophocarpus tetragonolobus TaxID=3891 RepID=A0AAN9SQ63_PSOTE
MMLHASFVLVPVLYLTNDLLHNIYNTIYTRSPISLFFLRYYYILFCIFKSSATLVLSTDMDRRFPVLCFFALACLC